MSRWLVVGSAGMLGHDLMCAVTAAGHEAIGRDLPEIDITSRESVRAALSQVSPDVVVNAAAYTAVDRAETEEAVALRINGEGPGVLAAALAEVPAVVLVHLSTDYVFAGDATSPYSEDAAPAPRTAYGRTKLAGEQAVLAALPDRTYLVRTAWLYGEHGPNFPRTMLRLEKAKPQISVVDDQRGQPTWTRDLAAQIVALVERRAPFGIYHGTSSGDCTWYEFTAEIYRLLGADPARVRAITSAEYPSPTPRPAYSVLGHDRWAAVGLAPIRSWQAAIAEALPGLREAWLND
ncbi:MAG: dTDP-4-dehydrorhamnose reductase [Candidatus Nanopelagicales bacterium]